MTAFDPDTAPDHTRAPDPLDWLDDALPPLYGYFVTRVGGRVDVTEDLTQETVLAAVHASNGPPPGTPVMAWLYGIARHKLIDHYRKEERDRRQFDRQADPEVIAIGPSPPLGNLDLEYVTVRADIVAALDRLPPRQRSALVLRYFDDLDVAATADLLGLSVHATESLLARGRTAFRRRYRDLAGDLP